MPKKRKLQADRPSHITLSAVMIVQNAEDIVGYSVTSLLAECDEVVIVDGIGHDRTEQIIRDKAKELNAESKLKYFKNRFVTFNEQRNFYLKHATSSYVLYCDSDEVITVEHLKNIRAKMGKYDLILVHSNHFYIDFHHIITGGGWDSSYLMPRCFRNLKGRLSYAPHAPNAGDHDLMVDATQGCRGFWQASQCVCSKSEAVVYHYGYALSKDRSMRMMQFFLKYNSPEIPKEQYIDIINKHPYFNPKTWEQGANPNDKIICKYAGYHPDIMKTHPMYNVVVIKD